METIPVERRELERDARERERDRRQIAGSLHAWWVVREDAEDGQKWGLIIANEGAVSSVFYDIEIFAKGNRVEDTVRAALLPPGRFFVESSTMGWGYPSSVCVDDPHIPITGSSRHSVLRIRFTDQLGTRWEWTKDSHLTAI